MLVIPAIDLKDGKVVRLFKGEFDKVSVYSEEPAEAALRWMRKGARRIHVVDLDGARSGAPGNLAALKSILGAVDCPVQFGGGVRDLRAIEELVEIGTQYIILSTAAFEDPDCLREAVRKYGDRILVSVDTRDGLVRSRGWETGIALKAEEVSERLREMGLQTVIHTNVSRDGTLEGLDLDAVQSFVKTSGLKVIVAGGVGSLEDIRGLKALGEENITGVIVGRALYEGKVDLEEAFRLC